MVVVSFFSARYCSCFYLPYPDLLIIQMNLIDYYFISDTPTGNTPSDEHAEEVERIHQYCERIDRARYTSEHKRQLRFLLNSSSSSGSSGGACSAPILKFPNNRARHPQRRNRGPPRQNCPLERNHDSGISEGTESERSSATPPRTNIEEQFPAFREIKELKQDDVNIDCNTLPLSKHSNEKTAKPEGEFKICANDMQQSASCKNDSSSSLLDQSYCVNTESSVTAAVCKENADVTPKPIQVFKESGSEIINETSYAYEIMTLNRNKHVDVKENVDLCKSLPKECIL